MIRNVKDATAFIDRRFGAVGTGGVSLLRIAAWTLVGLFLMGVAVRAPAVDLDKTHYNRLIPTPWVRDVTLDRNDPRGFQVKHDPKAFTIAWIGPSTLQNISPTHYSFIPADVRERIPEVNGRPVKVDMYFLSGARVYDLYTATINALATHPDMILVDLNPIWLFNDTAVANWFNLNGVSFTHIAPDPHMWPLLAAFDEPQDVATGLAARGLPVIRDRWTYARKARAVLEKVSPLTIPSPLPTAAPPPPKSLAAVANMSTPLDFWQRFRPFADPRSPRAVRQLGLLRQSKTDGSVVNDLVIDRLLAALADSHIPAIAYVPPVSPEVFTAEGADEALQAIEDHLAEIAARHTSDTLEVKHRSAGRDLPPMTFNDLVHLAEDGPFVSYLSDLICAQLTALHVTDHCVPGPDPHVTATPSPSPGATP
jgi:hypothetical protein